MSGQRESQPHNHLTDDLLSAYMDGQVTAAERARIQAHLAGCASCAGELRALQATVRVLREMPAAPVPRVFTIPVSAPVRRPSPSLWETFTRGWGYRALQGATTLVALLLVMLCSGDLLVQTLSTLAPMGAAPAFATVQGVAQTAAPNAFSASPTQPTDATRSQALLASPSPASEATAGKTGEVPGTPTAMALVPAPTSPPPPAGAGAASATVPPPEAQPSPVSMTPAPRASAPGQPTATPTVEEQPGAATSVPPATPATPLALASGADTSATPTAPGVAVAPRPAVPETVAQPVLSPARLSLCGFEGLLAVAVISLLVATGMAWLARRRGR